MAEFLKQINITSCKTMFFGFFFVVVKVQITFSARQGNLVHFMKVNLKVVKHDTNLYNK